MSNNTNQRFDDTRMRFILIIVATLLIELTIGIQYWVVKDSVRQEVQRLAEDELERVSLEVGDMLDDVEIASRSMSWAIEQNIDRPDALNSILRALIAENRNILNCAVAFSPDYFPKRGRFFEPLATRNAVDSIVTLNAGSEAHNYFNYEWYRRALDSDSAVWSEPYLNTAGNQAMVTSYSRPIHNMAGKPVAVLVADVTLDGLSEMANRHHLYPSSYSLILSREGRLMVDQNDSSHVLKQRAGNDEMSRRMMAGERGHMMIVNTAGEKCLAFFAPIRQETGWSMAVVCKEREIYHDLRRLQFLMFLLTLLGAAGIAFIVYHSARNMRQLQRAETERLRINNELRLAGDIQQGMLPKPLSPGPSMVDVAGTLVPAREVGGDLYDYFIHDEKLYFAVGDVSGKGMPAALLMAVTRALFHSIAPQAPQPGHILETMNRSLAQMDDRNMFVTFLLGILDMSTGKLRYCNAGHNAPLLLHDDTVTMLDVVANLPLGVMPDFNYTSQEITLTAGDTLFLYTDGLTEATNISLEQWGERRMIAATQNTIAHGQPSAAELVQNMTHAVNGWVDGAEQSDDLTMLAIKHTLAAASILHEHLELPCDITTIPQLADFINAIGKHLHLDASLIMNINLAVEEAVVNVMRYAYPPNEQGGVRINAMASERQVTFIISDKGIPFDPTTWEDINTSLPAEERPVGGLGIHLVRQIMDTINYERTEGTNVLTLRKNLPIDT